MEIDKKIIKKLIETLEDLKKSLNPLNRRVDLHAIDATPAQWRGGARSSPLDRARTAVPSPRNDLVKNCRAPDALVDFHTGAHAPGAAERRALRARRRPGTSVARPLVVVVVAVVAAVSASPWPVALYCRYGARPVPI